MNKKKILIISAITIAVLLISGLVYYFLNKKKGEVQVTPEQKEETQAFSSQEILMAQQIKDMENIRQESGPKILTEQEAQQQIKEMEKIRRESGAKILTEKEAQQQIKEMEELRQKQLSN